MEIEACRRCSECMGCDHHWLEHGTPADVCPHDLSDAERQQIEEGNGCCLQCLDEAPDYVCKHCPATGETCMACGMIEPEAEAVDCPECGGGGIKLVELTQVIS